MDHETSRAAATGMLDKCNKGLVVVTRQTLRSMTAPVGTERWSINLRP